MSIYYSDERVTLHHGDCLDVLRSLPDASVDSVCTDPPYGLADHAPAVVAKALMAWASGDRDHVPDGRGFMGRDWDKFVPPPAVFDEALRVLKPGGLLLCFAGSRTMDLMTTSIRFAGFEIRDSIAWLYGSGFPKSLDVSKAIDKRRAEDVEPVRVVCRAIRAAMDAAGLRSRDLVEHFDGCHPRLIDHWAARDTDSQPALPRVEQWETLRDVLGMPGDLDSEVVRLNARKGTLGEAWQTAEVVGERTTGLGTGRGAVSVIGDGDLRAANSDDAREWQGWGTALKPAFEPVVVARKPLAGTVAANVLAHGTGALNIDGCRIEGEPWKAHAATGLGSVKFFTEGDAPVIEKSPHGGGRWPANVVLDESQAAALDEQSGTSTSRVGRPRGAAAGDGWGMTATGAEYDDKGGASRFFYVAKAPKRERPVVDGVAHPTVKPLALMRWLVRLVTPPGGTVLEPFAGSGTTIEACLLEGFRCVAIEKGDEYLPLILERIRRATDLPEAAELDRTTDPAAAIVEQVAHDEPWLFDLDGEGA